MISNSTLLILILIIVLILTNEDEIKNPVETFIDTRQCSPKCCKFPQYSINPNITTSKDKYVESMYTCFGGCPCVTNEDIKFITSRGLNNFS